MSIAFEMHGVELGELQRLADKYGIEIQRSDRDGGNRSREAGGAMTFIVELLPHAVVLAGIFTAWKWWTEHEKIEWSIEEKEEADGAKEKKVTFKKVSKTAQSGGSEKESLEGFRDKAKELGVTIEELESTPGYQEMVDLISDDK